MRAGWITKLWKQCANARCGKCRKVKARKWWPAFWAWTGRRSIDSWRATGAAGLVR